jgi:hypothetical protein
MPTFQITGPDGKKYRVTGENPAGAVAALKKMIGADAGMGAKVDPATNQPPNVPTFVPPGVEGYDPQTGNVTPPVGMGKSAALGAADTATMGFGDEVASYLGSAISGAPRDQVLSEMRGMQGNAQQQNPGSYMGGQIAGGVAQGLATGPASLSARATGSALLPRMLAGAADGAILGTAYGAGSGTDAESRATEALKSGGIGAVAGGLFPAVASGASQLYQGARNAMAVNPAARQAGTTPEALRMLSGVMNADDSLGVRGQAGMARAGDEAMLVDAGPTARRALDTVIQRSGPGASVAKDAIQARIGRDTGALSQVLNDTLGDPKGVAATRRAIAQDSAFARGGAYEKAWASPIDYVDPRGMAIESMVKSRVPQSAINHANSLMRVEGNQTRQIMAKMGDDGSVVFEAMPDVRQIDYITRALNDLAEAGEGQGALGGQNAVGRAYQNLSREIRDNLRELVPEYGTALETAADPIRRSQAVKFGAKLLSSGTTRDDASEMIKGMTKPEREALAQGVRSNIDDAMANVTRTITDGDVPAREAIKTLKDLSSRSSREKLSLALGEEQSGRLFDEVDRIAQSFDIRASVADNSATFARQNMNERLNDYAQPDTAFVAAQKFEPLNAGKRIVQSLTGQTPEAARRRGDDMAAEIARLLTQQGGAGQAVYSAIQNVGKTDKATQLMMDRILRALSGPQLSYPTATQQERLLPR